MNLSSSSSSLCTTTVSELSIPLSKLVSPTWLEPMADLLLAVFLCKVYATYSDERIHKGPNTPHFNMYICHHNVMYFLKLSFAYINFSVFLIANLVSCYSRQLVRRIDYLAMVTISH